MLDIEMLVERNGGEERGERRGEERGHERCFQEAVRQIGMMLTTSHNHIEDLHTVEHGKESLFPSIASFQMNDSSEGKT